MPTRRHRSGAKKDRAHHSPRETPGAPARVRDAWKSVRFALTVLALLVLFFVALHNPTLDRRVISPYTDFVTRSSAAFLSATGSDVSSRGRVISSPSFAVEILPVCNGLEVTAIYAAAVLAFSASFAAKLVGLFGGLSIIYLINVIRIAVLFRTGERFHFAFEQVHYYYAQALVVVATIGVWLVWVHLFSPYGRKSRRPLPD